MISSAVMFRCTARLKACSETMNLPPRRAIAAVPALGFGQLFRLDEVERLAFHDEDLPDALADIVGRDSAVLHAVEEAEEQPPKEFRSLLGVEAETHLSPVVAVDDADAV